MVRQSVRHRKPTSDYRASWSRYKKRRVLFVLAFLGYVPICDAFAKLTKRVFGTFDPAFILALVWMAMFYIAGTRLLSWPCPKCGKCFSGTGWQNKGLLAPKCVHCGLPKYAPNDDGASE